MYQAYQAIVILGAALNEETQSMIWMYLPYVVIAVMLFMLFDRRRDKLRDEMQGISDALKSVGFHDLPPMLDAIVRGDWEAAKTIWQGLKSKYGSKEGVLQAVANIIEESLEKIMDGYPKLASQLKPVIDRVAIKLGYVPPQPGTTVVVTTTTAPPVPAPPSSTTAKVETQPRPAAVAAA